MHLQCAILSKSQPHTVAAPKMPAPRVMPPRAANRAAPECRRMRKLTKGPPRTTSTVGIPSLEHFLRGFKLQPGMVLHVTLEYTVPHLGFTTALTYGGLGKARPGLR